MQTDKKATFVVCWFGTVYISFVFSILLLVYLSTPKIYIATRDNFKLYAALPQSSSIEVADITPKDGRAKIIENFFKGYNSPLSGYARDFVKTADKYKLDPKLLPAIAMQESLGGKKVISNSYNPFGWGIYDKLVVRFSSWEEGIERVGRSLREDYLNRGLNSPAQIMTKYTPPSLAKGGTWAKGVSSFMEELK